MSSEGLESVSYPSTKGDAVREQAKSVPVGRRCSRWAFWWCVRCIFCSRFFG